MARISQFLTQRSALADVDDAVAGDLLNRVERGEPSATTFEPIDRLTSDPCSFGEFCLSQTKRASRLPDDACYLHPTVSATKLSRNLTIHAIVARADSLSPIGSTLNFHVSPLPYYGGGKLTQKIDWALARVVELDEAYPGVAGSFLRASAERRQVIAALLAAGCDEGSREIAELICSGRHSKMLLRAYGVIPTGLRGALSRSGPEVHEVEFYGALHANLVSGSSAQRSLIAQLPELSLARLTIAAALPVALRTPGLVMALRSVDQAIDVAALLGLFSDAGAPTELLVAALRSAKSERDVSRVWRRNIVHLTLPAHPVPESPSYRPIQNARELRRLALDYRNCSRRYLSKCLDATDSFALFVANDENAIIHLRHRFGRWFVEGILGPGNGPVKVAVRAEALSYLKSHGVAELARTPSKARKWEPLREVIGRWDFDEGVDEGWG